ncbi:MAG: GNAT family N-acetyltransferase, partial [Candidatus Yanofskybacteria bacterium]|nr:GNAT family N-acetyltransferase [Candidatus Yanofskybacteria bacterium]
MKDGISLRTIIKEDLPALKELLYAIFASLKDTAYPADVINEFESIYNLEELEDRVLGPRSIGLAAFSQDQLIGFVWGFGSKLGGVFTGDWGAVDPEFRGRGIFSRLMHSMEQEIRKKNYYKFYFYVSVKNLEAIRRYLKLDYKIEGLHRNSYFGWDFFSFGK